MIDNEKEIGFRGVAVQDSYKQLSEYRRDVSLPLGVQYRLGCINCEFRDMGICPFGFRRGNGYYESKNSHTRGICEFRRGYLKSFIRDDNIKNISENRFWLDYNKGIAQDQLQKEQASLFNLNKELEMLTSSGAERSKINSVKKEYYKAREQWFDLWKGVAQLEDRSVDRDTPKTVNLNNNTISVSQFQNMINGIREEDIIEGEFEEIKRIEEEDE